MTTETSNARGEWVLVPREPTAEMVQASDEISCRAEGAEHWAAMLAAAPQPPSAPVGVRNAILEALNLVHAEGRARVESATAEMADRLAALAQQPAAVGEAMELVRDIAGQRPEKPDYWSSCGQCESNIGRAQEVLEAFIAAQQTAAVGTKPLPEFMAEQEALHPGIHDKVQAAADELRASLAQQPAAAEQASGGCKGPNCTASVTNDHKHSSECLFEHAANVASGIKSVEMGVEIAEHLTYVEWRGHRINLLAALAAQRQEPKS